MIRLTKPALSATTKLKSLKKNYSNKAKQKFKSVVGLEVHAQINTASKLFSSAKTNFSSPVNQNVSLFDCSTPGTLPVLNRKCVENGILTALALNCKVNLVSRFDRKHYFYADMPTGYQITQQRHPLAEAGNMDFQVFTPGVHKKPYRKSVRIKQLQLEQDSGKSLHDFDRSLVDLNRAGSPLMELVFEPDLEDGEEAAALVKELVLILLRINTCNCKMEEGSLRVDANVSIHREGEPLGTRTEVKNIGSVRGIAGAVRFEIERQIGVLSAGGRIVNETRAWDAQSKVTVAMRDKEQLQDYRYMPEPNLPFLHLTLDSKRESDISVEKLQSQLPEMPEATRQKLQEIYGLSLEQAVILVNECELFQLFNGVVEAHDAKLVANLLINDYLTLVNKHNLEIKFDLKHLKEIIELLERGEISRITGRLIMEEVLLKDGKSPTEIVNERNLKQITDEVELKKICRQILEENEKAVKQFHEGKTKVFKAFMGMVASKTENRADMNKCSMIMKELLKVQK